MNGIWVQFLCTGVLGLNYFVGGLGLYWPSYTVRLFESDQSPLTDEYTPTHTNLLGSIPMLGCVIATLSTRLVVEKLGKKYGEILSGSCFVLCWSIICTTKTIIPVLIARCIMGLGTGFHGCINMVMIAEYSSDSIRGTLISFCILCYAFGTLASYLMGWFCSYGLISYVNLGLSATFVVLMMFVKETPKHLLRKGREKEAMKSLRFYNGSSKSEQELVDELISLKSLLQAPVQSTPLYEQVMQEEKELNPDEGKYVAKTEDTNVIQILRSSKSSQRGLLIACMFLALAIFMGVTAVQTYAGLLFAKAAPTLSPDFCSVILAISVLLGSLVSTVTTDLLGRRILMMASASIAAVSLLVLATLLRWSWAPVWLVPAMVLVYCFAFQLGAGSVPYTLTGEVFIPEVSSFCATIVMSVMWVANFASLSLFPVAVQQLGLELTFLIFSGICALTAVVSYLFLPETKGLDMQEIQLLLADGLLQVGRGKNLKKNMYE